MAYNFDKVIERTDTDSIKYDFAARRGMPEDILPLWVADMDFPAPDEVIDALVEKSKHGIFGYSEGREDYYEAVAGWYERHYDWRPQQRWLVKTPGVVYAVTTAIHAYTGEGDGVLIQEPVYYPFRESIEANNRRLVVNQLVYKDGRYTIDLKDFEEQIKAHKVKLFILCSPHNPVGRVWSKEELTAMGDICQKHGVLVVADEIHSDFTYPGYQHHVFSDIKEAYEHMTITCTAPSKTFNLAGLQISNVFIADKRLRDAFKHAVTQSGYSQPTVMGLVASKAAYLHGDQWLQELKEYLVGNLSYFRSFIKEHIPEAKLVEPEGTYLVWVDFSQVPAFVGQSNEVMDHFMAHSAKLWLDGGTMFGVGGEGFQRFNIACPRAILERALNQLAEALKEV